MKLLRMLLHENRGKGVKHQERGGRESGRERRYLVGLAVLSDTPAEEHATAVNPSVSTIVFAFIGIRGAEVAERTIDFERERRADLEAERDRLQAQLDKRWWRR